MPLVTPETVKRVLKDFYDYELSEEAAVPVANTAGAMISLRTISIPWGSTRSSLRLAFPT